MGINIQTPNLHHLALRVSDFERARKFYKDLLGFQVILEEPNLFIFMAGSTAIAIRGPENGTPRGDVFNPFRIGLDHLALACENEKELKRVAGALDEADIENTGIKRDDTLNRHYIAFKDPDRIAWEFYMV